jgi:hypothetical protein
MSIDKRSGNPRTQILKKLSQKLSKTAHSLRVIHGLQEMKWPFLSNPPAQTVMPLGKSGGSNTIQQKFLPH